MTTYTRIELFLDNCINIGIQNKTSLTQTVSDILCFFFHLINTANLDIVSTLLNIRIVSFLIYDWLLVGFDYSLHARTYS